MGNWYCYQDYDGWFVLHLAGTSHKERFRDGEKAEREAKRRNAF